ncbi:mitochondrial fusion and transport protein ugo1 [Acrodontium crateriforme]|uniref:Mitochondrial fusion and transport protein ugo1 n=1 Tax=Acrodontium crateriforme TaxID=150365 RepID=A0AAQ3M049_9PEZI|nr:mitochondrial fusion and transport protein ugo1 [Acrodontium crateriforme]
MERDRFPLSTSRQPNPLRPYYIPPSIGSSTSANASASQAPYISATAKSSSGNFSRSARDLLPELDLDLQSSAGEAWSTTRSLFDTLVYRYVSVLLAQPFDVSKLLLQVSLPSSALASVPQSRHVSAQRKASSYSNGGSRRGRPFGRDDDEEEDSEQDDDVPEYFSSAAPRSRSPRRRRRTPPSTETSPSPTPTPRNRREQGPHNDELLHLTRPESIMQAISAIYNSSGAVGLWRATNCTFLYSALLRTTDSFIRSLLLAIIGLPDISGPDQSGLAPSLGVSGAMGFSGLDLTDSPNAIGSLVIVGLSSCIAGILLSPLDTVRTRLIVTPLSEPPRGLVSNLKRLPSALAPSSLWVPTALAQSIPQMFSAAAPLVLRRRMRITPELTPSLWGIAGFVTCLTDLFLRLPLETIVRRAQVDVITKAEPHLAVIVPAAPYKGVWGTVYSIMYLEGETRVKDAKGMVRVRRGQGTSGLVRGWRVGFWGLVGVWGAGALGPGESKVRGEF